MRLDIDLREPTAIGIERLQDAGRVCVIDEKQNAMSTIEMAFDVGAEVTIDELLYRFLSFKFES